MRDSERRAKIVELIETYEIGTQGELAELLVKNGFFVTQATVSRDIRLLNLTKKSDNGKVFYVECPKISTPEQQRYVKLFKESVVSVKCSSNLIVIKTISGTANSAAALLDSLSYSEILGSVAGDDTIITVLENETKAKKLMHTLLQLADKE